MLISQPPPSINISFSHQQRLDARGTTMNRPDIEEEEDEVRRMESRNGGPAVRRRPKASIGIVLAVLLLVNLAMSVYQLPINRVIERRLCLEYYRLNDPTRVGKDGNVDEQLCKLDDVQKNLGSILGVMETIWIVGGESAQ